MIERRINTANEYVRHKLPEVLRGGSSLLPFDFLRTGDRLGRAVVKIARPDGNSGTGFLVGPGVLLTNHHVLPTPLVAASSTVTANFESNPPPDSAGRVAVVPLRPADLFVTDHELDITFCGVRGLDFVGVVRLDRAGFRIEVGEYVNVIQHPRGGPKRITLQDNRVVEIDSLFVRYSCDTEPGSSGSPVFNNRWQLVAMHHASIVLDRQCSHDDAGCCAGGLLNEGIATRSIALWLDGLQSLSTAWPGSARLCALFNGSDRDHGLFGALGYPIGTAGAGRFVTECLEGLSHHLDIGYWHLVEMPVTNDAIFENVTQAIAEMRMDLWFLSMASSGIGERLCRALEDRFDIETRLDTLSPDDGRDGPCVVLLSRAEAQLDVACERLEAAGRSDRACFGIRSRLCPARFIRVYVELGARAARRPGAGWPSTGNVSDDRNCSEPVWPMALEPLDAHADANMLLVGDARLLALTADLRAAPERVVLAATSPAGGIALLRPCRGKLCRVVLSPNLLPAAAEGSLVLQAIDRDLPAVLAHPPIPEPLAARLVFADEQCLTEPQS